MPTRILIVDDERNIRQMLSALLEEEGHEACSIDGGASAASECEVFEPDVVLLDLVMPGGPDGLDVLEQLVTRHPDIAVIMMSGKATLADAVRAIKLGAFQFLEKPLAAESVVSAVAAAAGLAAARAENRALRAQLPADDTMVGSSTPIVEVKRLIARVAPTPSRVLITGESGTGKELVARAIHAASARAARPFVPVNCAAVPRELIESEMFGHEKGAFTGAHARRHGKFELAHQGTLFLDEVGDLEPEAQAKLLRVLETGQVERVGGERARQVDVRVVAATNKRLEQEVKTGRFREDLYYRLNVFPIQVPPLRERTQDLPALTTHFAALAGRRCARPPRTFPPEALDRLRAHHWPGNVRELANLVERLTIIGEAGPVSPHEIQGMLGPPAVVSDAQSSVDRPLSRGLSDALEQVERDLIEAALETAHGNVAEAARCLETDRGNLYRRMRRLGLGRADQGSRADAD